MPYAERLKGPQESSNSNNLGSFVLNSSSSGKLTGHSVVLVGSVFLRNYQCF